MTRALALVLVGLAALLGAACAPGAEPPAGPRAAPGVAADSAPHPTSPHPTSGPSEPTRIRIPAIGVDSPIEQISVDGSGALVPPEDTALTGWFGDGPIPGATGPALLAGHVDSRSGPAVFYRLRDLPTGARILVDGADGSTVGFLARRTFQSAKAAFPTAAVYAPTPAPELRLVTCGGTFNRAIGHYRDNVVIEAVAESAGSWTVPGRR